jgi:hypothetical protein
LQNPELVDKFPYFPYSLLLHVKYCLGLQYSYTIFPLKIPKLAVAHGKSATLNSYFQAISDKGKKKGVDSS